MPCRTRPIRLATGGFEKCCGGPHPMSIVIIEAGIDTSRRTPAGEIWSVGLCARWSARVIVLSATRRLVSQKGHILVVESDDLIRQLLERWLGEAGYAVVTAPSDARPTGSAHCLVIADVPSPREAGDLIRSLQLRHAAPILVTSARFRRGLGASAATAHWLGVRKVLPKPFTRKELLVAVDEAMGRS